MSILSGLYTSEYATNDETGKNKSEYLFYTDLSASKQNTNTT